jgi:NADPH-dependent 2,4-dienoyl-CoA reductase/sulfur reductase-like enzyme
MAKNILVIGGGPAGVWAAIEAKRRDGAADVTLLTEEACEPYEKPPLSKAVLLGKARPADADERPSYFRLKGRNRNNQNKYQKPVI